MVSFMKKQINFEIVCWFIGALIWGIVACFSYSEERFIWVWIQFTISIGFCAKAITLIHRNRHYKLANRSAIPSRNLTNSSSLQPL